jgi:GT2 family glycosyltransferase/glycosyltransferase involved in cell wall biosynthesis
VSLTIIDVSERVPTERGEVALCIPLHGAHDEFVECLRSVLAHTPIDVPIVVADDASPDDRSRRFLEELEVAAVLKHRVYYTRSAENRGFVLTANDVFQRTAPADVVVVNSDCVVTEGWFEAMRAAAQESTLVATVSVLTNHGTILSLPHRNRPQAALPQTIDLEGATDSIRANSLHIRPQLPTVVGHCFYVKRAALDLVGPFDSAFSPGYGEEVDFSQRCVLHGLVHVVADDAFVLHKGSASFSVDGAPNPIKAQHDSIITSRYPYYDEWIQQFSTEAVSPFARAISAAERSLRGLTVSIDGRCLTPILTGTQLHTLEVIAALSRNGGVRLRVAVPIDLGDYAGAVLQGASNVEILPAQDVSDGIERSDVVHRPYQVSSHEDLAFLDQLGKRIVITHQDLIAFHNPGYFNSFKAWAAHRRLTTHTLALADRVVFFSRTAAEEAIAEELVERERTDVVYIGTDHTLDESPAVEEPPSSLAKLNGRPFLLCLGTDFTHKNRAFALRVLVALREHHDWSGGLVFAGPHVPVGSSASEEASLLAFHPDLADSVIDVAAVDEGEKRWLLRHAALMLYPSVHEGFGLVPFEAADAGLVCAFAAQTSIAELLPHHLALIEQWGPEATAARVVPYLTSDELCAEHVAAVLAAGASLTWWHTARGLLDVYTATARSRASHSRKLVNEFVVERRELEATQRALKESRHEFSELEKSYRGLGGAFDGTAEGLIGPNGVISPELRRPLLAICNRRFLRVPTFGLLRVCYRTAYRIRHLGRAPRVEPMHGQPRALLSEGEPVLAGSSDELDAADAEVQPGVAP